MGARLFAAVVAGLFPAILLGQRAEPVPMLRGTIEVSIGSEDDDRYMFANVYGITLPHGKSQEVGDSGENCGSGQGG